MIACMIVMEACTPFIWNMVYIFITEAKISNAFQVHPLLMLATTLPMLWLLTLAMNPLTRWNGHRSKCIEALTALGVALQQRDDCTYDDSKPFLEELEFYKNQIVQNHKPYRLFFLEASRSSELATTLFLFGLNAAPTIM